MACGVLHHLPSVFHSHLLPARPSHRDHRSKCIPIAPRPPLLGVHHQAGSCDLRLQLSTEGHFHDCSACLGCICGSPLYCAWGFSWLSLFLPIKHPSWNPASCMYMLYVLFFSGFFLWREVSHSFTCLRVSKSKWHTEWPKSAVFFFRSYVISRQIIVLSSQRSLMFLWFFHDRWHYTF